MHWFAHRLMLLEKTVYSSPASLRQGLITRRLPFDFLPHTLIFKKMFTHLFSNWRQGSAIKCSSDLFTPLKSSQFTILCTDLFAPLKSTQFSLLMHQFILPTQINSILPPHAPIYLPHSNQFNSISSVPIYSPHLHQVNSLSSVIAFIIMRELPFDFLTQLFFRNIHATLYLLESCYC